MYIKVNTHYYKYSLHLALRCSAYGQYGEECASLSNKFAQWKLYNIRPSKVNNGCCIPYQENIPMTSKNEASIEMNGDELVGLL